ncbi:MAG: 4-hydroxy-tetrahydrodipicolinate synthase [Acidimicrobiia bacterium]|nr:4-hydroxy-tetrahydrodipicolinate synthase [Acidimicrobiia bacterium]
MARFGQVITAMITPFDDDGHVDLDGAGTLARWLVAHGSDGLVLTGTTGEVSCLNDREHVDVWRAVRSAVDVPLLVGAGTNDTRHAATLVSQAAATGMDGVLLVTPYYNRPSQAGIEGHFRTLATATALPVVLYDIPVRTGRKISTEVLVRLASEVPNVVGVKDAAGDVAAAARLVAAAPADFELYSGDDALTLPLLSVGAVGVISVCTHWAGEQMQELFAAWGRGDVAGAAAANRGLLDSYAFESSDDAPNPVPAKAMLRAMGLPAGQCRPPHGPAPAELEAQARQVLAGLPHRSSGPARTAEETSVG